MPGRSEATGHPRLRGQRERALCAFSARRSRAGLFLKPPIPRVTEFRTLWKGVLIFALMTEDMKGFSAFVPCLLHRHTGCVL